MNPATGPQLRDIHLPPMPSWWPPAPGWWLLGALLLGALVIASVWLLRRWRVWRWRRRIDSELAEIAAAHDASADGPRLAAAISQMLRRGTLLVERRAAALPGEAWLEFLDARIGGQDFRRGAGRALIDAPYRRAVEVDAPALTALARRWLARALRTPPARGAWRARLLHRLRWNHGNA
ncbi:MAG: DUF4381 domain-containing protein [Rhodanobacteraceae bacterium]